jgi:hypothetical protein
VISISGVRTEKVRGGEAANVKCFRQETARHHAAFANMDLSDLTFYKHPAGFQAVANFPNSYGLSIIPESDGKHYEVAVLKDGFITYESGLTEDVFRFVTVDSVDDIAAVASRLQA